MCGSIFHTSKGSIIADASIALPAFILAFSLILSLIYEAGEEDALYRKLSEDTVSGSVIIGALDVDIPFMLAVGTTKTRSVRKEVCYRPFCGESSDLKNRDVAVYIFPKSGTRYHIAGCSTLDRNQGYIAVSRSEAKSLGYTECMLCGLGRKDYFKKPLPLP